MPRDAATNQPPGGRRVSKSEADRRMRVVEGLLASGLHRSAIIEACKAKFRMSPRTTDDYIRQVRDAWVAERAGVRSSEVGQTLARLTGLAAQLAKEEAWGPLIQCEKLMADIRGVRVQPQPDIAEAKPTPVPTVEAQEYSTDEYLARLRIAMRVLTRKVQKGGEPVPQSTVNEVNGILTVATDFANVVRDVNLGLYSTVAAAQGEKQQCPETAPT